MTLAQRIQEIRSAAGPLLRDAPGMSGYIAKIDGICHDVQEVERERDELKAHVAKLEATLREIRSRLNMPGHEGSVALQIHRLIDNALRGNDGA